MPECRIAVLLCFFLDGPSSVSAQPRSNQIFLDAVYATRAMWRGTPRVSSPVMHLAGALGLDVPGGHLSAGVWTLVELQAPDSGDYTIGGPERRIAEFDYSLQYAARTRRVDLIGGFMRYQLLNDAPTEVLSREFSTTELYAAATFREGVLRRVGLTPTIRTWLDVNKVVGSYTEFELTYAMPVIPLEKPLGVIHLSARTGFSLGQSTENGSTGYFDEDGFTHIETLVTITGQVGAWVGLGLTFHRSFGLDGAAKRGDPRSAAMDRGSWGWIETWLTARLPGRTRR